MPSILTQAIELLTHPPGDLVYFLIVLFAIEAMLGLAIMRARRSGWTGQLRLIALAAIVLLIGRVALIAVALLSGQNIPPDVILANAITPPLERYVDLISLTFLALAFVPLLRNRLQLGLGLVTINLIAATIFYALAAKQWYDLSAVPNVFYNATQQEVVWQAWLLAIATLAAVAAWLGRGESAGLTFTAFLILAIGSAAQLIFPVRDSNVAGWVSLAELIAYPIFAIIVYQITETEATPRLAAPVAYPLLPTRSEAADEAWLALTTVQDLSTSADLPEAMQRVATTLCQSLMADLTAIGLLGKQPETIDLTAIYHPGATPVRDAQVALEQQPIIKRALDSRQAVVIEKQDIPAEIIELYGLMGSFVGGPLIIAPLVDDHNTLGIMLFGNPDSGRAWSAVDAEHAQTTARHVAVMLTARENRRHFASRIEELENALRQQETEATQRRTALEALLLQSQTEAQKAATRLAALVALQEAQSMQQGGEREQIQQLTEQRAQLERQTQEYQSELNQLIQLQVALETQLKQAQQDMARLQEQLPSATPAASTSADNQNGQQREVIAAVVQELRTPMTSIAGYTDLLLGESVGILGAMQRQFLQRVKSNIARMEGMLSDLVEITTIDTGPIKLAPAPVDVPEVINDAVMSSATLFREREQSIRLELADHLPKLHTDRDRVHQIMLHLLSNAALCSPNNSEVVVRAQVPAETPDYVLFSVTDQGGGIAPEDRQRAFHRMYRADHPLIQGLGETGVGLSIAKALVEAQSGRIWVDSEMGSGSTFSFVLPLLPPQTESSA